MLTAMRYRDAVPFKARKESALHAMKSTPGHLPVICERAEGSLLKNLEERHGRLLLPRNLTVGGFIKLLRVKLDVRYSSKAIFLLINGNFVRNDIDIQTLYSMYADEDGCLYMTYMEQDVFG